MSVDVFIYFYDRLPCGLDEIEDILDQNLKGFGEVVGSGVGTQGSNVDLCVHQDDSAVDVIVENIRNALLPLGLPASSEISIHGTKHLLTVSDRNS